MEIVDSHQHFWHPGVVDIPWLSGQKASFGDPAQIRGIYTPQDYLSDAAPLAEIRARFMSRLLARPEDALIEAIWATGIADAAACRRPSSPMPIWKAPPLKDTSTYWGGRRCCAAFACGLISTSRPGERSLALRMLCRATRSGAVLRAVAARGLVFNLSLFSTQLPAAAELAAAVPEATLVLEHFGWPASADADGYATGKRAWRSWPLIPTCV